MDRPSKKLSVWTKKTQYGTFNSETGPNEIKQKWLLLAIVPGVLGFFLLIFFAKEGIYLFPLIAIVMSVIIGIGVCASIDKEYKKFKEFVDKEHEKEIQAYEEWEKEHPHFEAEEFYLKLEKAGISEIDSEYKKEKMLLFIKNNDLKVSGTTEEIVEFFYLGKREVERLKNEELVNKHREEEKEFFKKSTKYADLHGTEKSLAYYQEIIKEQQEIIHKCKQDREKIMRGGEAVYAGAKQPEHDWALHGGIASGIAGTGAGIATAMDIQNKNAQIRHSNQELASTIGGIVTDSISRIYSIEHNAEDTIEFYQKKTNDVKNKIVKDLDPEMLFTKLNPSVKSYKISDTGAVKLKVEVNAPKDFFILEDTPAVIDGTLYVDVIDPVAGETVGEAICVLPIGGVEKKTTIDCICLNPSKKIDSYDFYFASTNLWAIEK